MSSIGKILILAELNFKSSRVFSHISIHVILIIGQPTYGYPAVDAANEVINQSWDLEGNLKNVADSVGIMVYEGTQSLNYVKNFVNGADQWEGFPIKVNVNSKAVMLGN